MTAHVQHASVLSGRHLTLMAVIGLHALIITALIAIKIAPPTIANAPQVLEWFDNPPEVQLPPPPPKPQLKPVEMPKIAVFVPPLIVPIDDSQAPAETIQVAIAEGPTDQIDAGAVTQPGIPARPARAFKDLEYRAVLSPDDFYPATSVALQEQGISIVNVCVGANGRIDGQPSIQTSSGYKRLDQAAIRWAREALRFTPATENGVGVRACKGFRVVFNLN